MDTSEAVDLFMGIGLSEGKAKETTKNPLLTSTLVSVIKEAGAENGCEKSIGALLYQVATTFPARGIHLRPMIARKILEQSIKRINLDAVIKYVASLGEDQGLDMKELESQCGIGVNISGEDISSIVREELDAIRDQLLKDRYLYDWRILMKKLQEGRLRWGDRTLLSQEIKEQIQRMLGPRTTEDEQRFAAAKKMGKEAKKAQTAGAQAGKKKGIPVKKHVDSGLKLPLPQDNRQIRPDILKAHLERTGGRVVTRFPPEPNGYLHIGHAKSMLLNFGYAKKMNGVCYLRFDDTNPEKESQHYIDMIIDNVKWMGHEPYKITYASQYFDELYECAVKLIKLGKAYVCHLSSQQMKECKQKMECSPWRDRSVEDNLKEFEKMRQGRYAEGEAVLRLRMDMKSDNPCMWDLVAYRVKYTPHPKSKDRWCIYPSYDFTHCLCDSFEDITHSMCTLEFLPRHESYDWLVNQLELYRSFVWEFSRLNLTKTVISKRKLLTLIDKGFVRGWDDPRLPTLMGLRRKGYCPSAINNFCEAVGTTTSAVVFQDYFMLEQFARQEMEARCTRAMAVFDPLRVRITNWPEGKTEMVKRPNHPMDPSKGENTVPFTGIIYIERSDFALVPQKNFWGLTPGGIVGLRYTYQIRCSDLVKDDQGNVVELLGTYDPDSKEKPKGHIHWVSQPSPGKEPCRAEIRNYEALFKSNRPDQLADDWIQDVNVDSLVVLDKAYVDDTLKDAKPGDSYQFERLGFYCVDPDTSGVPGTAMVWNRTVSLKESRNKPMNDSTDTIH